MMWPIICMHAVCTAVCIDHIVIYWEHIGLPYFHRALGASTYVPGTVGSPIAIGDGRQDTGAGMQGTG